MKKNFRDLLTSGRKFVGTILQYYSPEIIEIIAAAGYDYIIIDNEHSCATYEQTLNMLRTADSVGLPAMIRIPEITEDKIKKALDMGFSAIRIPTVSTVEEAKEIIRFAKFPPEGERGACPFVRANSYGAGGNKDYYARSNRDLVVAINIEGPEGIKNMEEIIALDGIDIINVGRVDLSVSLGVPGQVTHPMVEKVIRDVSDLCIKYGKCSGTYIERPEQAADYKDYQGITHFLTKTPESILLDAYHDFYQKVFHSLK